MIENHIDLLNNTPIFGGSRTDTIQLILESSKVVKKSNNQYFFKDNDLADSMFILISGQVEVQKTLGDKTYQISHLLAGDCFGEMAIIDHCTRSASVIALETCQAIELGIESFNSIYTSDIKQYTMLQMNMGREVSRRLRLANERLFETQIKNDLKDKVDIHSV